MNKMIGIVGGVGSYAGIDLLKKIYDHTGATCDQEHLPVSMLSAPHKVLDRTKFLLGEIEENPADSISEIITTLVSNGAEIIGIPCNTAHAPKIFNKILSSIPEHCKLLNLIDEVGDHLSSLFPEIKKVGVLCTNGTLQSNIYPDILSKYSIEVIHPSDEIQSVFVHPAIYNEKYGIKALSNPVTDKARQDLMMAASNLSREGAEAIILGCTEIPLAITDISVEHSIIIDATSVLAKALIRDAKMTGMEVKVG